jgi:hypothetical protein
LELEDAEYAALCGWFRAQWKPTVIDDELLAFGKAVLDATKEAPMAAQVAKASA